MDMSDLPPPPPESTGQPEQSELPTAVQPIDEFGNPFEISDFKDASFLNGLFITLIVALIFSEISFVVTIVLKIRALDLYYSEFSKISIVDPNHQHARSELVTANAVSGIVAVGCLFFLLLSSICMLCWMFRNYKNSIALAQGRLKYSAGEATAGLAIPFVSLSRPYFAVIEMVKIAKDRINWDSLEAPVYVHLWWLFNISAIAVAFITRFATIATPEPVRSYVWNDALLLVYGFAVFKNLFLIRIVLAIWEGMHQRDQMEPVSDPELRRID
jgi:hypothetical protein